MLCSKKKIMSGDYGESPLIFMSPRARIVRTCIICIAFAGRALQRIVTIYVFMCLSRAKGSQETNTTQHCVRVL